MCGRLRLIDKNQKGFTLIETLVAVAILGLVGIAFPVGLSMAASATSQANVRTTARSLATSQMETIQTASYAPAPSGGVASYTLISLPANYQIYTLDRNNNQVSNQIYGIPWNITTNVPYTGTDPGIQKLTVIIQYNNKQVFTLTDFKQQ